MKERKGNVLFNDALNTFYLRLYGVGHMVTDHSDSERGNPLLPHGLLFPISSNGFLLYASSRRQDNTYHNLCYTSRGALAGTRNSSMGPLWRIDPTTHRIMSKRPYHGATSRSKYEWMSRELTILSLLQKLGKPNASVQQVLCGLVQVGTELGESSYFSVLGQLQFHWTSNLQQRKMLIKTL